MVCWAIHTGCCRVVVAYCFCLHFCLQLLLPRNAISFASAVGNCCLVYVLFLNVRRETSNLWWELEINFKLYFNPLGNVAGGRKKKCGQESYLALHQRKEMANISLKSSEICGIRKYRKWMRQSNGEGEDQKINENKSVVSEMRLNLVRLQIQSCEVLKLVQRRGIPSIQRSKECLRSETLQITLSCQPGMYD